MKRVSASKHWFFVAATLSAGANIFGQPFQFRLSSGEFLSAKTSVVAGVDGDLNGTIHGIGFQDTVSGAKIWVKIDRPEAARRRTFPADKKALDSCLAENKSIFEIFCDEFREHTIRAADFQLCLGHPKDCMDVPIGSGNYDTMSLYFDDLCFWMEKRMGGKLKQEDCRRMKKDGISDCLISIVNLDRVRGIAFNMATFRSMKKTRELFRKPK